MNHLTMCLSRNHLWAFYKSPFSLFHDNNANVIETTLSIDLKKVVQWLGLNILSLKAAKIVSILFYSYELPLTYYDYLDRLRLTLVNKLDKFLNWDVHWENLGEKFS